MQVKGIKRGKTIELVRELDLTDGAEVTVEVRSESELEESEKLRRLNALFGCWENQPELDDIFAAIAKERHEDRGREIDEF